MSRYYVKMDVLEEKGDEILSANKQLKDDIEDIKKIISDLDWMGEASESYSDVMKNKVTKLEKVTGLIDIFGTFMKKGASGFNDVYKQIQNSFEQNNEMCPKCGSPKVNGICPVCNK